MFRTAKPRSSASSEPKIWSEGQQFAPLDLGAWSRVSAIVARRAASRGLARTSVACANLALGLEKGRWKVNFSALGPAAAVIPSRLRVARGLARLSRLQAMAAEIVDHQALKIAPLEITDLSAFMQARRLAARAAEAALRAPSVRPLRPARKILPVARTDTAAKPGEEIAALLSCLDAPSTPTAISRTAPLADVPIDNDALMAIRMAINSAPEPVAPMHYPGSFAPEPAARPVARSVFATASADWYEEDPPPPPPEPVAPPSTRVADTALRLVARLGRGVLAGLGRGVLALWLPVKGSVAKACAAVLGWASVALVLPYGALRATILHAQRVDLRYFD